MIDHLDTWALPSALVVTAELSGSPFDNEFTKLLFPQVEQGSLSESIQYPCLVIFIVRTWDELL